jgi:enamine deaminase RidA (YjgF/YER057c/UK114 family)
VDQAQRPRRDAGPRGHGQQRHRRRADLGAILDEAGSSKNQLLSVTIYLKDLDRDFEGMNAVYDAWLGDEKPTRACVQTKLGHGWLVEIRANAAA